MQYDSEVPSHINKIFNALVSGIDYSQLQEIDDQDPNRFDISKENESQFIASFANSNNSKYTALSTEDYYNLLNPKTKWENLSSKEKSTFDTENGDIIVVDEDNVPICFIDIKISDQYFGAISLGSIANFNDSGYYICICKKTKQAKIISHKALINAVKDNRDLLNPVVRGRREGYPVKWEGESLSSEYFVKGKTIEQIFK